MTARATPREFGNAAYTLFKECVVKRGMGGIAGDIGKFGRGSQALNIPMTSQEAVWHQNVRAERPLTE